jgi:hypothetical protein
MREFGFSVKVKLLVNACLKHLRPFQEVSFIPFELLQNQLREFSSTIDISKVLHRRIWLSWWLLNINSSLQIYHLLEELPFGCGSVLQHSS